MVQHLLLMIPAPPLLWMGAGSAAPVGPRPARRAVAYDLALRSDPWHHAEHACFFLTGLAFWRPIILPWTARASGPRWAMIVYLLLAEPQNTVLAAILTFSDRVIYPAYRAAGASALDDQALAGVIMRVPRSAAFALARLWLVFQSLGPSPAPTSPRRGGPAPRPRDDPPPCPLPLSDRR